MYLGIDIGSLYLSLAILDEQGNLVRNAYEAHRGNPMGVLRGKLDEISLSEIVGCAKTGSGATKIAGIGPFIDSVVAQLDGTRAYINDARNIVAIGAGSFTLIRTNERGEYSKHSSNLACASGTGAFLDQQALRLEFKPEELHLKAACAKSCPSVATRCAVFAKSDIIHLQQAGFEPEDIAAGLCRGLGRSAIDQLLQGRAISGKTVMIGGVARNPEVVKAVEKRIGMKIQVPERPELTGAIGAALYAKNSARPARIVINKISVKEEEGQKKKVIRPPLELKLSDYPEFKYHDFHIDGNETEAALVQELIPGEVYPIALGIDIGSTSTKCTLVTPDREMLAIYYRATAGNPIQAVKHLFSAIRETERRTGASFQVIGAGTTGSGRKFIRKVVGADIELDEITAHARAATFIDPEVDTIIELGGQDAKFTQLQNGIVYNSVMNYVCAAGTGSFIEEQAKKLDISIWEYADFVMGMQAPFTSDRCTVYMERDLEALMAAGYSKREIAAAVLFSVRDNYLNKVVDGLHIGDRVYFQGATARNKALVAAFEEELGKPIAVSPYCHVTGALGMSLMVLDEVKGESTFRGIGFANEETVTTREQCTFCTNECAITVVTMGNGCVKWGFKCGRDDADTGPVRKKLPEYDLFKLQKKLQRSIGARKIADKRGVVAAPRSLTSYGYLPFWRAFFAELGYELKISPPSTNETLVAGESMKTAEFCAPVVLGLGHARAVTEMDADYYFFPYMIREEQRQGFSNSHFCPHVQSHPALVKALFPDIHENRLLRPVFELNRSERFSVNLLMKDLGPKLGVRQDEVRSALRAGKTALSEFNARCLDAGRERLAEVEREGKMAVVVVGRPYNTIDSILSLDLPKKIAEKGITVFPVEFVPLNYGRTAEDWPGMYWAYGQTILAAADVIRDHPNLFGVFLTNFSCGPDSYLLSYFKHIMAGRRKPHVTLQLDAHGADAGYLTRIEAAIEAFRAWRPDEAARPTRHVINKKLTRDHTLFMPVMDSIISPLFAASFRRFGYKCEVLDESEEILALGLKHCSGGECLPCPSTLGGFLQKVKDSGVPPQRTALFMPMATGPCRFGQYHVLQSLAFKKLGMDGVVVITPSSENAYGGLSSPLRKLLWDAVVVGDIMHKVGSKIRPYEMEEGQTDNVLAYYQKELETQFARERGADIPGALGAFVRDVTAIRTHELGSRPLIGVVGEIYVRSADFSNGFLVREIERLGGEALQASIAEWILYTDFITKYLMKGTFKIRQRLYAYLKNKFFHSREKFYTDIAGELLRDRLDPPMEHVMEKGGRYVPYEFQGESILTLGRTVIMIEEEGVQAVVNASPTFCMPGTFTSGMFPTIEERYGVPIICNFYDGSGEPNRSLIPHLHYLRERLAGVLPKAADKARVRRVSE
ncbi:MAG: hypothetical protein E3J72_17300 [Planctomycetota bacterium]|nr:MAG: hypothetical protein E3J72_17300 [Planctomycetota bacterium]